MTRAAVGVAFGRAAGRYEAHAEVQRAAAESLARRIGDLGLPAFPHVLELGCGTGLLTRRLPAGAWGLVSDLSPEMVAACRAGTRNARFVFAAMDAEAPAAAGGFDLVCASLVFQWLERPAESLARLAGLVRPGGWLAFSTLGPETFASFRAAQVAEGLIPATPRFFDVAEFLAGWPGEARRWRWRQVVDAASGRAFLDGVRGVGAGVPRPGHQRLGVGVLRRVMARFERDHACRAEYDVQEVCAQISAARD